MSDRSTASPPTITPDAVRSPEDPGPQATQNGIQDPTLLALGWTDRLTPHITDATLTPGRVLRHDGVAVLVGTDQASKHYTLRPSTPPLAVGDWVLVDADRVVQLLPRASALQRRDPSTGGSQLIAANVDIVGIVCGLDRPVNAGRIQRFTSLAWDAGASPLVILTKTDLVDSTRDIESELFRHDPAIEIVTLSSQANEGVTELLARCAGRTLVLVGESGAGKSTLLNALGGTELGVTGSVRDGDSKGKHTTTSRQLFVLEGNCCLIDTPGVREVGLHTDVDTIDSGFADITDLAQDCRFGDCGHGDEPGCAVQAAVVSGEVDPDRLRSWDKLRREAAFSEIRTDTAARRKADRELGKMINKAQKAKRR